MNSIMFSALRRSQVIPSSAAIIRDLIQALNEKRVTKEQLKLPSDVNWNDKDFLQVVETLFTQLLETLCSFGIFQQILANSSAMKCLLDHDSCKNDRQLSDIVSDIDIFAVGDDGRSNGQLNLDGEDMNNLSATCLIKLCYLWGRALFHSPPFTHGYAVRVRNVCLREYEEWITESFISIPEGPPGKCNTMNSGAPSSIGETVGWTLNDLQLSRSNVFPFSGLGPEQVKRVKVVVRQQCFGLFDLKYVELNSQSIKETLQSICGASSSWKALVRVLKLPPEIGANGCIQYVVREERVHGVSRKRLMDSELDIMRLDRHYVPLFLQNSKKELTDDAVALIERNSSLGFATEEMDKELEVKPLTTSSTVHAPTVHATDSGTEESDVDLPVDSFLDVMRVFGVELSVENKLQAETLEVWWNASVVSKASSFSRTCALEVIRVAAMSDSRPGVFSEDSITVAGHGVASICSILYLLSSSDACDMVSRIVALVKDKQERGELESFPATSDKFSLEVVNNRPPVLFDYCENIFGHTLIYVCEDDANEWNALSWVIDACKIPMLNNIVLVLLPRKTKRTAFQNVVEVLGFRLSEHNMTVKSITRVVWLLCRSEALAPILLRSTWPRPWTSLMALNTSPNNELLVIKSSSHLDTLLKQATTFFSSTKKAKKTHSGKKSDELRIQSYENFFLCAFFCPNDESEECAGEMAKASHLVGHFGQCVRGMKVIMDGRDRRAQKAH